MSSCICSTCKNLKSVADEEDIEGNGIIESCEFGFPSEDCETCELEGCELTCDHYVSDMGAEDFIMTTCAKCGVSLRLMANRQDGEVYCIDCYLQKQ